MSSLEADLDRAAQQRRAIDAERNRRRREEQAQESLRSDLVHAAHLAGALVERLKYRLDTDDTALTDVARDLLHGLRQVTDQAGEFLDRRAGIQIRPVHEVEGVALDSFGGQVRVADGGHDLAPSSLAGRSSVSGPQPPRGVAADRSPSPGPAPAGPGDAGSDA